MEKHGIKHTDLYFSDETLDVPIINIYNTNQKLWNIISKCKFLDLIGKFMSVVVFTNYTLTNQVVNDDVYKCLENIDWNRIETWKNIKSIFNDTCKAQIIEKFTISEKEITNKTLSKLISKYGPRFAVHSKEEFFPCTMEDVYQYYKPYLDVNGKFTLELIQPVDKKYKPPFWCHFYENKNKNVKCYIVASNDSNFLKLQFFYFYGFNLGKKILLLKNKIYGNHFMDIEQVYIKFDIKTLLPVIYGYAAHGHITEIDIKNNDDNHKLFYIAKNSHGTYTNKGNHVYNKFPLLVDKTDSNGYILNTWENYICITPDNFNGLSETAFDQNGDNISLKTPYNEIYNWTFQTDYIGHESVGPLNLKPFTNSTYYRYTGHVKLPFKDLRSQVS